MVDRMLDIGDYTTDVAAHTRMVRIGGWEPWMEGGCRGKNCV